MSKWPMVPLRDVLEIQRRWIKVEPLKSYREIGIRCFGNGIFHKAPIEGSTLGNKRVLRIEPGDLVFNNVFAWEGAVAVAGPDEAGMIGSHRFVTYTVNPKKATPQFLQLYFTTEGGLDVLRKASPGSAGRNKTLGLERFISQSIPLPPLSEQQKIVKWIDAVATRVEEAKRLQTERAAQLSQIFDRIADRIFNELSCRHMPLSSLLIEDSRNGLAARPTDEPPGIPILRISAGTSRIDGIVEESDHKYLQLSDQELETYRLRKGDLLACRFNGNLHYVGRFSVYQEQQSGDRVYPDKLIRFRVDRAKVDPEFVVFAMNNPAARRVIEGFCQTTAGNIGISAKVLKNIEVPVPPPEVQSKVTEYLKETQMKLIAAGQLTNAVGGEVDAILPSILNKVLNENGPIT